MIRLIRVKAPNKLNRQVRQVFQPRQRLSHFLGSLCVLGGFIHFVRRSLSNRQKCEEPNSCEFSYFVLGRRSTHTERWSVAVIAFAPGSLGLGQKIPPCSTFNPRDGST